MNGEGFEEWDADFLDQLIQVEELALCSSASTSAANQNPNPSLRLIHVEQHEPLRPVAAYSHYNSTLRYSPPRELSQRNSDHDSFPRFSNAAPKCASSSSLVRRNDNDKELEIERLKRELGHVSKQLTNLEQECLVLRKERDKEEGQLLNVFSKNKVKDVDVHSSKSTNLTAVHERKIHL